MKIITITSYIFSLAIVVLVLCLILGYSFDYSSQLLGLLIVVSSILFFLNAYYTRKKNSSHH